jgi:Tfp pilus assembly protein PilN
MANINLLPWRDAQRRDRNRATLFICIAMWLGAALVVLAGKLVMDARIDHQEARNQYLQNEINALSKVIAEIEDLKMKRDELIARMDVIQNLQRNRSQVVHVFDDLVSKQPEGVFYDSIEKRNNNLSVKGKAQSNNRISTLMRSVDASEWLKVADLKDVGVVEQDAVSVSQFDLVLNQEGTQDEETDGQIR